jgi:hypothetical protein
VGIIAFELPYDLSYFLVDYLRNDLKSPWSQKSRKRYKLLVVLRAECNLIMLGCDNGEV